MKGWKYFIKMLKLEWGGSDLLLLFSGTSVGRSSLLFLLKDSYLVKRYVLDLQFMNGEL